MDKTRKVRDKWVNVRMNQEEFDKLETNRKKTTERNNSDYIRKIAFNQPVKIQTRDASLDALTNEVIRLRKELNAIGHNFNQAVHKLHTLKMIPEFRTWITEYEQTRKQIATTAEIISKLIRKNNV